MITARVKDLTISDRAKRTCTHEKGDVEHAGDVHSGKGVAELQESCPCGSRSSLTQPAPDAERCGLQGGWSVKNIDTRSS